MPARLIERLSDRGERAGRKLVARFAGVTSPMSRPPNSTGTTIARIRQRVALSALEELALEFVVGFTGDDEIAVAPRRFVHNEPMQAERTYEQLLNDVAQNPALRRVRRRPA
jgi:hypothetical protein